MTFELVSVVGITSCPDFVLLGGQILDLNFMSEFVGRNSFEKWLNYFIMPVTEYAKL